MNINAQKEPPVQITLHESFHYRACTHHFTWYADNSGKNLREYLDENR